jgi:hypothetical protein
VSPEDIGRMTIDELEAAASRVAAALAVLKEAGAWKPAATGKHVPVHVTYETGPNGEPVQPPAPQRPPAPAVRWSPSELAERERLLKQMRPEFPPEIESAEGT